MGGSIGMCYASGQSGPRGGACNFNFTYEEEAGGKKEAKTVCVLFDFDGTIGNTNKAAMEVAFWELAPYFVRIDPGRIEEKKTVWVRKNAGHSFEYLMKEVEKARERVGLPSIEDVRRSGSHNRKLLRKIDKARARLRLWPLEDTKFSSLLEQAKDEMNSVTRVLTSPTDGIETLLLNLEDDHIPFSIASTSSRDRILTCLRSIGYDHYFPNNKIHSAESDFKPSRFKPHPDVYLKGFSFLTVLQK
mmetsp:Transcript_45045/g.72363  ORF Transcript_45045/g.72363 Transcript_45045/m.72363 type:complete len:246 (-) Transcript_45045:1274-2011(-)